MKTRVCFSAALASLLTVGIVRDASAAFAYATAGDTYTQNFNTLPKTPENASPGTSPNGWIDDTASPGASQFSIVGWYIYHPTSVSPEGGANNHGRLRASAGTQNTGAFYSFGASGN